MENLYRLYIDESGNHHYSQSDEVGKQYLSLTGVIISLDNYESDLQPRIKSIKKLFSNDPDNLPILHREDIVNKKNYFNKLQDTKIKEEYNRQLLSMVKDVDYKIICVVIDKKDHLEKYSKAAEHPYHYCLTVMLERYTNFLATMGRGDVCAEARGKKEDLQLKASYTHFYTRGTNFREPDFIQSVLTSKEIKLKIKSYGIEGLEFTDLLCSPTKFDVLVEYEKLKVAPKSFTKQILNSIQNKYVVGRTFNNFKGYGKKLI